MPLESGSNAAGRVVPPYRGLKILVCSAYFGFAKMQSSVIRFADATSFRKEAFPLRRDEGAYEKGAVRRTAPSMIRLPASAAPAVSALLLDVPQLGQLAVGGLHKLLQPVLEVGGLLGGLMDKAHGA